MNLKLLRTAFKSTGIYGEIEDETGKRRFFTLEHSYSRTALADPDPGLEPEKFGSIENCPDYLPKLAPGTYTCVRGQHQLHHGLPFETFMVTGVPKHEGILFHVGNYDRDSEGCILIGKEPIPDGIGKSGDAFKEFIELQRKTDSFILEVV